MSTLFFFKNKYVCGAYFNSARDNFHRTMIDILHQIGVSKNYTETELDNRLAEILNVLKHKPSQVTAKDAQKIIANQNKFRQLLFRHFPILGPIISDVLHGKHRQKVQDKLNELVEEQVKELTKKNEAEGNSHMSIEDIYCQAEKEIKATKRKEIVVDDCGDRDTTCAECLNVILLLARCLSDCRNYFTHYCPYNSPENLKDMYYRQCIVSSWLSPVFNASRRLDKRRNRLTSAQMEFITSHNYKVKKDNSGKNVKDESGKDVYIKNHTYYFSIVGESFIAKCGENEYLQKNDYDENSDVFGICENFALSDFGLIYLCCCFLTRSQTRQFVEKAELFADSPENMTENDFKYVLEVSTATQPNEIQLKELERLKTKLQVNHLDLNEEEDRVKFTVLQNDRSYWQKTFENQILLEMLSIYRVRLPRGKRLDKQDNKAMVALDMLNELRRCPKELYDVLSPEGQQAFVDPVKNKEEDFETTALRKRFTDRFPYLALRAIDEAKLLPSIRFQVQLGYYRFAFYDKICIDGTSQLRRLGKALNGFGRLSAMETKRKTDWAPEESDVEIQQPNKFQRKVYAPTLLEDGKTVLDLLRPVEDQVGNAPYVTDAAVSYNIYNNRIGLYWETQNNERNTNDVLVFPELKTKTTEKIGALRSDVPQHAPLCMLSVRDLPALLFLLHLNGYNGRNVEQIIVDKYEGLVKFFSDISREPKDGMQEPTFESIMQDITCRGVDKVLKDYDLILTDIPDRLKECLFPEEDVVSYFKRLLAGTAYALSDNITEDKIKDIIAKVAYEQLEKEGTLPKKVWKKIPQKKIINIGLGVIMGNKGKNIEDLPENIRSVVYRGVDPTQTTTSPKIETLDPVNDRFLKMILGDGEKKEGRLEKRIQWVDRQMKKFIKSTTAQFSKDNRYGTKSYKDIRYGRLAEILAESMIMWQPMAQTDNPIERGRNKLTGLNYRRLVDFLATYNEHSQAKRVHDSTVKEYFGLEALSCVLKESGLVDSKTPHPFLPDVLAKRPRNVEILFQIYMNAEKDKLNELKRKYRTEAATALLSELQCMAPAFVHPLRNRWSDDAKNAENVKQMAARYVASGRTLLLPDGLFTEEIIFELRQKGLLLNLFEEAENEQDETKKKLLEQRNRNVSFLISRYIEAIGDHCQLFYDGNTEIFYRGYDIFKKLYGKKVNNELLPEYMSLEKIAGKLKAKDTLVSEIKKFCESQKTKEAEQAMIREISHVKRNERAIFRYKIQDIVLFLTAKKLLQSQQVIQDGNTSDGEITRRVDLGRQIKSSFDQEMQVSKEREQKIQQMKLQDVFDGEALNVTMDYKYRIDVTWKLRDEQGRVIKFNKEGSPIGYDEQGLLLEKGGKPKVFVRKVYITQKNVAIKNFGKIFRVVKDERLEKLLILLILKKEGKDLPERGQDYTVSIAELANEFSTFDSLRTDAFAIIHELEKTAHLRMNDSKSSMTHQFNKMMHLICSEEEAVAINQYRISFAHSVYGINEDVINTGLEVPLVSTKMKEQMAARSNNIKEQLDKQNL